jgi:thymidine kinase
MIRFITGEKGSGKTRKLIDMANDMAAKEEMNLVYIDRKDKYRREVVNSIRFIDLSEFYIYSADSFFGFLNGLISGNYDIGKIYVDEIENISKVKDTEELNDLFAAVHKLSTHFGVEFIFTINKAALPADYEKYTK